MILRKEAFNHMQFNRTDWEKYNREELIDLYEYFNNSILNKKCSYDNFIKFCFQHSTQFKPDDYNYERVYKKRINKFKKTNEKK